MSEQQMATYTLTIQADSGYESTTEGRCTAEQYGQAMAALHGTSPAQRKPLTDEQRNTIISQECRYTSEAATEDHHRLIEAVELLHNIKENT